MCHQQDGRLCAGWVGVHDMSESFGLRMAMASGAMTPEVGNVCLDYTTDVPLYGSGTEACAAGIREIETPGAGAINTIVKLKRKGKVQ